MLFSRQPDASIRVGRMSVKSLVVAVGFVLRGITRAYGMDFTVQYNGGNCDSCAWVLAEGIIDAGTTEKFRAFVAKEKPPTNIRFDSLGGDVIEALKFGQFLRESNWDTFVGDTEYSIPGHPLDARTQKSGCYSACVYAFAG